MDQPPDVNPYAPPSSDVNAAAPPLAAGAPLARRVTRFVAQVVDALLYWVALAPALVIVIRSGAFREGSIATLFRAFLAGPSGVASGLAWVALFGLQAYLVTTTGQSVAKKLFKIKIVKTDGRPVNFVSGVLLRSWLLLLLQQLPVANLALPLLDALFIFRQDRRCLHDLVAGTKVIDLTYGGRTP